MFVYQCKVELHDSLYFASREIGKLYETAPLLHNYALCYALGLAVSPYHFAQQVPQYQQDLEPLNDQGVYVTPGVTKEYNSVINTWKYERHTSYSRPITTQKDTRINLPLIGRTKEIDTGTIFQFYVVSMQSLVLPHWIRLGKWLSKAEVTVGRKEMKPRTGSFVCNHLLNPLDLIGSANHKIAAYTVFNVPPVSLIRNVYLQGDYYDLGDVQLPAHMEFCFS